MKLILEPTGGPQTTFKDVESGQFFIHSSGCICQKVDRSRYHVVATKEGKPYGSHTNDILQGHPVKILPKVLKFEID